MSDKLSCPTDHIKVSANQARLTALLVFLTSAACLLTGYWWIILFLTLDFYFRAFGLGAYSPFNLISSRLEKLLALQPRTVDRAPKVFSAQFGFLLADCLLIANIFELTQTTYAIAGLLLLFSFLESAFGFCAGCHVYTFLKRFSSKRLETIL